MDTIFKAFRDHNQYSIDDLIKYSILDGNVDFMEWAWNNNLFHPYKYYDFMVNNITIYTYENLKQWFDIELEIDNLVKLNKIDILKFVARDYNQYPTLKMYKLAKLNGQTELVKWLDDIAEYNKY